MENYYFDREMYWEWNMLSSWRHGKVWNIFVHYFTIQQQDFPRVPKGCKKNQIIKIFFKPLKLSQKLQLFHIPSRFNCQAPFYSINDAQKGLQTDKKKVQVGETVIKPY